MASTQNDKPCPDWVFSLTSNTHIAKDRAWFTTYIPFTSTLKSPPLPILGIGTVDLPVLVSPGNTTVTTWELEDVLHIPSYSCNVVGGQLAVEKNWGSDCMWDGDCMCKGRLVDAQGELVAYFVSERPLYVLAIQAPQGMGLGQPVVVNDGVRYLISCDWEEGERKRWQAFQKEGTETGDTKNDETKDEPKVETNDEPRKNEVEDEVEDEARRMGSREGSKSGDGESEGSFDAEKEFIKKHWGSDGKFMLSHSLNIWHEGDRQKGRSILKKLMSEGN